jgi:fructoselysine-6-P-deglycase FrlB-like protein
MSIVADEIQTQPDLWRRAGGLASDVAPLLGARGERVCVVGCGTSLYVAQAWAALREAAGHGETDAFPASELPAARRYDVLVAISRSGTTTDSVEPAAADAERALVEPLPVDPASVEQWTFLGRGWTVGLAHEAALKLRETAQAWTEAYPAFEYRHGPVAIAAPGRVVWSFGPLHPDIAEQIGATGATVVAPELDPLASLVLAQRAAVALAESRGLDPDEPRNLTRSIVLSDGELDLLTPRGA